MTHTAKQVRLICLIGRVCAGKDMASLKLVKAIPNARIFSFGQLLRDSRELDHPLHTELSEIREESYAGIISSESQSQPFIDAAIHTLYAEGVETVIANGYPRSEKQVSLIQQFTARLQADGYQVKDQYVYFFTPRELSEQRIDLRRIEFLKARKSIRIDDQRGKSVVRQKEFEDKTWEAVRHIAAMDKLIVVDARRPLEELHQTILDELSSDKCRPVSEAFQELRGWTDQEEDIPMDHYESRMRLR